jgi:hypothetical protein
MSAASTLRTLRMGDATFGLCSGLYYRLTDPAQFDILQSGLGRQGIECA